MAGATNIIERFLATVDRIPDRPFLVAAYTESLERLTYGEALRRARSFAQHLRGAGVARSDRVVLRCPNSVEYICAYFGTWLAGATAVPLDARGREAHAAYVYHDCGARCMVVPTRQSRLDPAVRQIALDEISWDAPADGIEVPLNPLALIIYTSGTTGTPKGVCLSHTNLDETRAAITSWAQVTEDDRELTTLSLTHLFGLAHVHVYSALGGTVYIEEGLRDVPRLLDLIDREQITSFPGTPAGFRVIVDHFADAFRSKASRLRYIVINSAPMPVEYTRKLLALLPDTRIYMYYGLTEASRSTYIAYRDHPDKLASVGRASPCGEVLVGSAEHRLVNEPGEILVKGSHVTSGYWGMDSSQFFDDGWFRTGDLGVMDEEGFVTWLGRVREQINVNGLKLVPAEVEDVLRQDPRVRDCAVASAPDPLTGEAVIGFVVTAGPPEQNLELQLRKLCSKHLEAYKIPKRILFIDEIPKTDSGKVKRFLLRERLELLNEG
jgi:long-chain acyl-CoA synthetase